jgi:translocation and assembly module TamA
MEPAGIATALTKSPGGQCVDTLESLPLRTPRAAMAQRRTHVLAIWRSRLSLAIIFALWAPLARANIEIEVKGVDEELRANVIAYLSFDRYRKSESLTPDTLERLHNRVDREVAAALKPFGYYEPKTESNLEDLGGGNWRVNVNIDPGRPVLLDRVDVHVLGPGSHDILFTRLLDNLPLRPGNRLNHAVYDKVKGDLQRTASNYGYFDAKLTRNELLVDPPNHKASIVLELETGDRYRFGTTHIDQSVIDDGLVRRYMRYRQDEPFDMSEILRTQFALDDSQYFSNVEVLPDDPDREAKVVSVNIRAEPNRRNRYSFGAGYGTDTDIRGTLQWENRRINSAGHRFNVLARGASKQQSLESHYIVPIGDPALEKLDFETTYEKDQPADIDTTDTKFEPSITKVFGRWQRVYFLTFDNTTTESLIDNKTDFIVMPGISFALVPQGYLGEALFSNAFFIQLRGSYHTFGSNSDFLQLDTTAEHTFDFGRRWHLLLRGEVGSSLVSRVSTLPGSVRFFAGGDRSVRGFGYQELSPVELVYKQVRDETTGEVVQVPDLDLSTCSDDKILTLETCKQKTVKVGGKHLITGTVEIQRDLPHSFGVATFFDFGNAFDRFGDPLEYSVGIGFRWRLPAVTLGIDVAQPLSEPGASPRLHINFTPKL